MPNPLLDFSLEKVDWRAVASKIREAVAIVVAATPSPLDDVAIAQLGDSIIDLIIPKAHQAAELFLASATPTLAASAEAVAATRADKRKQIEDAANAAGVTLSPTLIMLLLQFGWPLIQKFIERLRPATKPAA